VSRDIGRFALRARRKKMRVGLDFGTTNSSAAVVANGQVRLVPLDPVNAAPDVLRSALFIARDARVFLGREAIDRYTAGNVGREIIYERAQVGTIEMTFAEVGTIKQDVYVRKDANAPGRLFLSIKMALPDSSYSGTNVFGTRWTIEELIALMLKRIRERVEEETGQSITEMVIGRPVNYAGNEAGNARALSRMQAAAELAGLRAVRFLPEPTAAAMHFASRSNQAGHVLVFDSGGGTLDITIMRVDSSGTHKVLATDGVAVGGDLMDRRIVMGKLLGHFGAGAELGPRRRPLPAFLLESLDGWQSIVELHSPRTLDVIDEAIATGNRPTQLRALRCLVRENYGLPLYEMVEAAKRRLSESQKVELAMDVAEIHFSQPLERWDFERLIGPDLRAVEACLLRAVSKSGLEPEDIDHVVRTGGSSRLPRYVQILETMFPKAHLMEQDVYTSVASGLAIAADTAVAVD
jgi:hypothetical chaperone protein